MAVQRYYLGCPMWANKTWVGELFNSKAKAPDFLSQYASVFTTVEGNTTFYALPKPATVQKWKADTPDTFRFCLKFPRTITHDKRLLNAHAETDYFLKLFEPLGSRLGPFFLQLRPTFSPAEMDSLEDFLRGLPRNFSYAVEVRNLDYFTNPVEERAFTDLLTEYNANRVIFDTRGLFSTALTDVLVEESKRKKPNMPVRFTATGKEPFVRISGDPQIDADINTDILNRWADVTAEWIRAGITPYIFIHSAPDDFYAPRVARRFHTLLSERVPVGAMPLWPAEQEHRPDEQMALF